MCFSAGTSFGVSALLIGLGVVAISKTERRADLAFAGIPFFFSIQQLAEGFLWLALINPAYADWQATMSHVYLFFAQPFWPFWVPLSLYFLEKQKPIEKTLRPILVIGLLLAIFLTICLIHYGGIVKLEGKQIHYVIDWPFEAPRLGLFFLTTVIPLFISSVKRMPVLGVMVFLFLMASYAFFPDSIFSGWCIFPVTASVMILWIVIRK